LKSGKVDADNLAAAYRAIAREKFFDGDLLENLNDTLCKSVRGGKCTDALGADAIECLTSLNAYDKNVFSVIARFFKPKLPTLDAGLRSRWLQSFQRFGHNVEKDFIQMLEVAPLMPTHPGYRQMQCRHHAQGSCALGAACTFSHDPRALPMLVNPDKGINRPPSVVLTQCQLLQGRGAYTTSPSY